MYMRHLLRNVSIYLFVAAIIAIGNLSTSMAQEEEAWAQEESGSFIRTWLLCGVFPNPPHKEGQDYDHTPPCVGLDTDYLTEHGGEAGIQPVAGMTHKRPDGTEAQWFEYTSPADIVDFIEAFAGQPIINVVSYSAEDIAGMGQLLLNRGSYGDRVFFSPEAFDKLLPKQLSNYYPELDDSIEWGIGLTWMRQGDPDAGKGRIPEDKTLLSRNTIGHGAASNAILRVDLDNEVVVSQVRNTAGPKYQEYFVKFLKAIDDSIIPVP